MTNSPAHLSHPKYRPDIDGLRAVAVLSVVAFHAFPSLVKGGFIGVDVFFVISGFLISTIIFENLDKGTFRFSEFYARRVKRIFPALLLVVIASYIAGWFSLMQDEYAALGKHIAAGAGFVSNFALWGESGYFDNAAETKPLLHLWSLGIEEQFYILWPFLLWFAWRVRAGRLLPIVILAAISFGLNIKGIAKDSVGAFYLPQSRFWELLSGSALAWFILYRKKVEKSVPSQIADGTFFQVLSWLGLSLLVYGFARFDNTIQFPGTWAIVPVLGTVLIILAGPTSWMNRNVLSNNLLVWFGLLSFPLYLWHWPLLSFARIIEGESGGAHLRIAAVVLSVILAWLTVRFIETPIRTGKLGKSAVVVLVIPMIIVGFIGYGTYRGHGLRFRAIVKSYDSVLATIESNPKRDECHLAQTVESLDKGPCEYFYPNPSVAVVGNSHAPEIAYALASELGRTNQGVMHLSMSGCPHNYNIDAGSRHFWGTTVCFDWHNRVVQNVNGSSHIKYVVLSYRNEFYLDNDAFVKSLVDLTKVFLAANKNVFLVLQAPMPKKHVKDYLRTDYRTSSGIHEDIVGLRRSDWKTTYKHSAGLIAQLPPAVVVIDPADDFCDDRDCYVVKGNKALFFDDNHMSVEGGGLIARRILKELSRDQRP